MRRGINIRKRKKIIFNEINKKSLKLLFLLVILIILCFTIYFFFLQDLFIKSNLKEYNLNFSKLNENIPFSIKKIILFSSATAESGTTNQYLSLDISQYCDIGIYLNQIAQQEFHISNLYIDKISISSPHLGTPYLYKKSISDIGKSSFSENNIINGRLDFNIVNPESPIDFDNYEIYSDGSTPLALGFFNKNIKTNFIIDKSEIIYDGTLLKEGAIPLTSLNCNISFTLNIITKSNEHYICNINFDIPFKDIKNSIYENGYIVKELVNTNKFIRIQ